MKSFLKTTASWGMLFCVLAAIPPALPWSFQTGFASAQDLVSGLQGTAPRMVTFAISAYTDWHGAAISIAGGIGLLFLVATGSLKPAPWWRTLGIGIVGAAIITFTIIYSTHHWNHFPVRESGGFLAIVSSVGLLFIACLETRHLLERRAVGNADGPAA